MGHLAINNKILDKYFRFLARLDNNSKKRLIIRLTESIETESDKKSNDFNKLFGAWNDQRNAEEIINEIKNSRIENRKIENF